MQQLIFQAPRKVQVRRLAVPVCPPDKLLVGVLYSGISTGTELLLYRGEMPPAMMADASIGSLGETGYPRPYGYAAVGRVQAVGAHLDAAVWQDRLIFAFQPHQSHFLAAPAAFWWACLGQNTTTQVTHWQPLPDPPQEVQE